MENSEKDPTIEDFEPVKEDFDVSEIERVYREQGLEFSIDEALNAQEQYLLDFKNFKKYYSGKTKTKTDQRIFLDHARYLTVLSYHKFTELMRLQDQFNRTKSEDDKKKLDDEQSRFTYWRLEGVYKGTDKALKSGVTSWQVEMLGRLGLPHEIDYDIALDGFRGTARDPNGRAIYEQQTYAHSTYGFYERLQPFVKNENQKNILLGLLDDFKQTYISRQHEILAARSDEMSSFVTGSSKFPTKRNQKCLNRTDRLESVFIDWYERALPVAKETLLFAASDDEKFKMLWSKLRDDLIENISMIMAIDNGDMAGFDRSSFVNSAARKIRATHDIKLVQKSLDFVQDMQKDMNKPVFTTWHSIWKILDEVPKEEEPEKVIEKDSVLQVFEGGEVRDTPSCDRVQIYFKDKPSEAVRRALKSKAWRWSPSNGVWQRKRTDNAKASATLIIKNDYLPELKKSKTEVTPEEKSLDQKSGHCEKEKPLVHASSEASKKHKVEKIDYCQPFSMAEKYEIIRESTIDFVIFRLNGKLIKMTDEQIEVAWCATSAMKQGHHVTLDPIRGSKHVNFTRDPVSMKIWASFEKIDIAAQKPLFKGKEIIKMLRTVYKIDNPDEKQGDLFF